MRLKNTSLHSFENFTKEKDIICFGTGKLFKKIMTDSSIGRRVVCLVDNNEQKWGTTIEVNGQKKQIISARELSAHLTRNSVVLITAGVVGIDIINQLQKMPCMENIDVFWQTFIMTERDTIYEGYNPQLPSDLRLTDMPLIPKIIHYCWVGDKPIPKEQQQYIDGWKRLCPDYEFMFWNEKNYNIEKNGYMKDAYEAKMWGFVPDYIRKDVVYEYGGIYFDTDVELLKPPDELLYQNGFVGTEFGPKVAMGLGFGARKKLPLLKELRDMYDSLEFDGGHGNKPIPAPIYDTEVFRKHGYIPNGKYQIVAEMSVYPYEILSGINIVNGQKLNTEKTIAVHHYAASWVDDGTRDRTKEMKRLYGMFERI